MASDPHTREFFRVILILLLYLSSRAVSECSGDTCGFLNDTVQCTGDRWKHGDTSPLSMSSTSTATGSGDVWLVMNESRMKASIAQ